MGWPQTINGHTYNASDFDGYAYITTFPTIINDVATVGAAASTSATNAATSATNAATSASAAAASAATAVAAPGTNSTSTTSLTIGVSSQTLTTQTGKSYSVGAFVNIARTSDGTKWMTGSVTAYNSGTGSLTVGIVETSTSGGTFTDWTISIVGGPGASTLPSQTGNNGKYLTTDGSSASWGAISTGPAWTKQNTSVTVANASQNAFDTTSAALTGTLPATPTAGVSYADFADYAGTFGTNALTVGRNGSKIMGLSEDMQVNTNNARFRLAYIDSTQGWILV